MGKNVLLSILLLAVLQFSLQSCNAARAVFTSATVKPQQEEEPLEELFFETPGEETREVPEVKSNVKPGVEPKADEALRQEIVDYARQFVGTGYKSAGKTPAGFDCSGFTGYVMGKFGIQLSASSKYQENDGIPIKLSETRPGDLVFFRRDKSSTVFHVAIVLSNDEDGIFLVHSTSGRGVVIDNLNESSYWKAKYATARRVIKP
jgi:cell wall-associated NlpC family hydrolase